MVRLQGAFISFFHFSILLKFSAISMDFSHPQNPDTYKMKKPILTSPSLILSHQLVLPSQHQRTSHHPPPASQTAPSPSAGGCPSPVAPPTSMLTLPTTWRLPVLLCPTCRWEWRGTERGTCPCPSANRWQGWDLNLLPLKPLAILGGEKLHPMRPSWKNAELGLVGFPFRACLQVAFQGRGLTILTPGVLSGTITVGIWEQQWCAKHHAGMNA